MKITLTLMTRSTTIYNRLEDHIFFDITKTLYGSIGDGHIMYYHLREAIDYYQV